MAILFNNNASGALGATLLIGGTTMQVTDVTEADEFPVVTGSDYCYITLEDSSGNIEIIKCTARASGANSFTIVRAQDNTAAREWQIGDVVEQRLNAAILNTLDGKASKIIPSADVNIAVLDGTTGELEDGGQTIAELQPLSSTLTTLSSATAAGLALMDDATAEDQRTTLGAVASSDWATGTEAYSTSGSTELTIAHGLGTDDIDITYSMSIDPISNWNYAFAKDANSYYHEHKHSTAYTGIWSSTTVPSAGDFLVKIAASGAISGNIKWTARKR